MKHVRQNVVERFGVAGHFERNVEPFFHAKLFHRVGKLFISDIQRKIHMHLAREIEAIRVYIGNDDVTRARLSADWYRHAAYWSRTSDEHIFAHEIERERGVNGVA